MDDPNCPYVFDDDEDECLPGLDGAGVIDVDAETPRDEVKVNDTPEEEKAEGGAGDEGKAVPQEGSATKEGEGGEEEPPRAKVIDEVKEPAKVAPVSSTRALLRRLTGAMREQATIASTKTEMFMTEHQKVDDDQPEKPPSEYLSVQEDQQSFVKSWADIVRAFAEDPTHTEYECPTGLSGYDRKVLHQLADQYNLGHKSRGQGPDRRLVLSKDALFYKMGSDKIPTLPTNRRIHELQNWRNLRRAFNPPSARIDPSGVAAALMEHREYEPADVAETMKEEAREEVYQEDQWSRKQRLQRLRLLNAMGFFVEQKEGEGEGEGEVAEEQPPLQPFAPPAAAPVARKRPPAPAKSTTKAEEAMAAFINSGLAPKTVTVQRASPDEPIGIVLSKKLLITEVHGVSEACGVPCDMFVNEVDGVDVTTPGAFTREVKGKVEFTLTLWFLRKDGFTVPKLKDIATRAEEALQRAVEAEEEEEEAGAEKYRKLDERTKVVVQEKCTVCESSHNLTGPEWDGVVTRQCNTCRRPTPWVVDRQVFQQDSDSDDDDDE